MWRFRCGLFSMACCECIWGAPGILAGAFMGCPSGQTVDNSSQDIVFRGSRV